MNTIDRWLLRAALVLVAVAFVCFTIATMLLILRG